MHHMLFVLVLAVASACSSDAYVIQAERIQPADVVTTHPREDLQPLDMMYVVDRTKNGDCEEGKTKTLFFVAVMCDPSMEAYDGKTARITLNMPYRVWDSTYGNVLYSDARANGKILKTNGDKGDETSWTQNYTFTYNKTFGSIFISAMTGSCFGSLQYGITLSFEDATPPPTSIGRGRYQVSSETMALVRAMEMVQGVTYETLNQIFRMEKKGTVATGICNHYRMPYCFGIEHKYNVTVAVVSEDNKSGFGTYVCPFTAQKAGTCPPPTPYKDQSGAPFNLVMADITDADHEGAVLVNVCGNGRHGGDNTYLMSSSGPRNDHFT